jgi:hypothetical protein
MSASARPNRHWRYLTGCLILCGPMTVALTAAEVSLVTRNPDPYGTPRPSRNELHVPLKTSLYFELGLAPDQAGDRVVADSVEVILHADGVEPHALVAPGQKFVNEATGRLFPGKGQTNGPTLAVSLELNESLKPSTQYTVTVKARSQAGAVVPAEKGRWQFTTEAAPNVRAVAFDLAVASQPVTWQGGFFTGFCKPSFCTSASNRTETYELMAAVRKHAPRAWVWQRDFWLTGLEQQPSIVAFNLPNVVRERETRRITALEPVAAGTQLTVEDFFGHEQYGIASNRPLSDDYRAGEEVLVSDGVNSARGKVISVNDAQHTVALSALEQPQEGWKTAYTAPLPKRENPNVPGLFPSGGCYLRKFNPAGTPVYYWGRVDREWDLAHRQFGHRLMPNFADAPGDLSLDGRNWTTAKDYAQLHDVVRTITGHLIDRYGDACLDFRWSVFNEPDLGVLFWRSDWDELQKFYDYATDGVLRAFEDRGYDSNRVVIGGLELAGIFGVHLRLNEFLVHCSPRAEGKGALLANAAFADVRLNGRRSRRVERLCAAHNGRGSPCDFISIHAYNASKLMAEKLIRAKEIALQIDPEHYANLWVNSHEACPEWNLPPDPACADSYLGNGYFPTWCADVARRQLQQAARDPRYGFGDSILTFWPWPNQGFGGGNDCVRFLPIDDNGDGKQDRTQTIPMPILHFLGLMSQMEGAYWVFPEKTVGGHAVAGFASRAGEDTFVLLYSHHALDTQSRSEAEFDVTLNVSGLSAGTVQVVEHRFDKDHNSYFHLGRQLREQSQRPPTPAEAAQVEAAVQRVRGEDAALQQRGLRELQELGPLAATTLGDIVQLSLKTTDPAVQLAASAALTHIWQPPAYPTELVKPVVAASTLRTTNSTQQTIATDVPLSLRVPLSANGATFLKLRHTTAK